MADKAERKVIMRFGDQVINLGLSPEQAEDLGKQAPTYWPDQPDQIAVEENLLTETHDASAQPLTGFEKDNDPF